MYRPKQIVIAATPVIVFVLCASLGISLGSPQETQLLSCKTLRADSVSAQTITITDAKGKMRAQMTVAGGSPSLRMYSEDGSVLIECVCDPLHGSKFTMKDQHSRDRIVVGIVVNDATKREEAAVSLQGEGGKGSINLRVQEDGQPEILMKDAQGKVVFKAPE
jgi:hypothetical protein